MRIQRQSETFAHQSSMRTQRTAMPIGRFPPYGRSMADADLRGVNRPPYPIRKIRNQDRAHNKPWAEMETLIKPHGKNVTLYHRTTPARADKLVDKGFKRKTNPDTRDVYFSDLIDGSAKDFGGAVVSVTVPHTAIERGDTAPAAMRHRRLDDPEDTDWEYTGKPENWYQLDSKNLVGVPATRLSSIIIQAHNIISEASKLVENA